jgi:acylglycerol lipase
MIDIKRLRQEFKDPHYFVRTPDDKILFLRAWIPQDQTNIAILIFHGITAHSGPYVMIGKALSHLGYAVYGLDLRGHGLSDGNRGDYPSKELFLQDIGETISFVKSMHKRLLILGHSLGVISAIYATNHFSDDIDGLILLSGARSIRPGVYSKVPTSKKLKILLSSLIKPSKPVISYQRPGMTGLDDPLYNFNYTLRFMKIFNLEKVRFQEKLNIPVLLGIGESDELFTIESARSLFNEIPSDNKKFIVLPGAKHAEFPENSWDELIGWLTSNFKQYNS